jgi:hypothetical protein
MELLMRAAIVAMLAVVAGCQPEILSGTYFCGPEMSCPPDQICSAASSLCVRPELALPFACPADSQTIGEPNNDVASATAITFTTCPGAEQRLPGCVPDPADLDLIVVDAPTCGGRSLSFDVRFPVAFAPVIVEQVDAAGTTIQTATSCEIAGENSQNDAACLDATVPGDGRVYVRLTLDPEIDCDDACNFNWYDVAAVVL